MGKKPVQLEEEFHEIIEDVQTEFMKETGKKPSKEEVLGAGLTSSEPDDVLGELFEKKKNERARRSGKKRKKGKSAFDEYFSL
jgi:hypothetical protein